MNEVREAFLADAAFAREQNGGIGQRDALRH
jgi:hypothetical protein